jgi:acetolactate synthase-1/2/3 large subunit
VLNNGGYLSIRHTQAGFLESRYVGSSPSGGLSLPDLGKVARAYGVRAERIERHGELRAKVRAVLNAPGPALCEIMVARDQPVIPRLGFDRRPDGTGVPRPLEDMAPFLEREEFLENMLIKPWDERRA